MMHPVYMPFPENQLAKHFADVKRGGRCVSTSEQHLSYFRRSLQSYQDCPKDKEGRRSLKYTRRPCQVEKDEKFWTAACLMTIFYSPNCAEQLKTLFREAYGSSPTVDGFTSWENCIGGDLHLFFETNLPSPKEYKAWLRRNLTNRQLIPYILDSDDGRKNLEGPTNVDAVILNRDNGFAVVIEAKVLSDISHQITYDMMRNQIARNIDVILDRNPGLCPPLNERDPEKTLFLLLTPKIYQENPTSRLYGYKFTEYKDNPNSLEKDLIHRSNEDWDALSKRLGWLTWEDCREVNPNCCKWLHEDL